MKIHLSRIFTKGTWQFLLILAFNIRQRVLLYKLMVFVLEFNMKNAKYRMNVHNLPQKR